MVNCIRCNVPLVFHGVKDLPDGSSRIPGQGDQPGAVYICPKCGSIEHFHPELGQELRAENPMVNSKS